MISIKGGLVENAGNSFLLNPSPKGSENHDGKSETHDPAKPNRAETAADGGSVYSTRNSIPEKVRVQIAGLLQGRLADSIDLTLQAKQAHWNVKGPSFIALHELFDKVTEEAEGFADLIAERIVQLGGIAMGTLEALDHNSSLPRLSTEDRNRQGTCGGPVPCPGDLWRIHPDLHRPGGRIQGPRNGGPAHRDFPGRGQVPLVRGSPRPSQ